MQFATKIEENRDTLQAILRRLDMMEENMFTQEQAEALCAQHYKEQRRRLKNQFMQLRKSLTSFQEEQELQTPAVAFEMLPVTVSEEEQDVLVERQVAVEAAPYEASLVQRGIISLFLGTP